MRFLGLGALGFVLFALWLFCIFDVIAAEEVLIRHLPKTLWLMIVIFLPQIGSVAWLALGRPLHAGWIPGSTEARPARRLVAPEDTPTWKPPNGRSQPELEAWEAELAERDRDLRRREDSGPDGPPDTINPNW